MEPVDRTHARSRRYLLEPLALLVRVGEQRSLRPSQGVSVREKGILASPVGPSKYVDVKLVGRLEFASGR